MSDKEETPEEIRKSRDSWKTWGILSIIGTVFFFIIAVLFLIFIIKYRSQIKDISKNAVYSLVSSTNNSNLQSGGCGACAIGGCDCTTGGCGCDITGGAVNSSGFLNKLLQKK